MSTGLGIACRLRDDENYAFRHQKPEIKIDFKKSGFSTANANSRAFILLLNSSNPYSFLSGAKIDTDKVLKKGSKHEFHHIYPQKYLRDMGLEYKDINVLANICYLTRADNNKIKARAPSDYLKEIEVTKRDEYLNNALCPLNFGGMAYDEFLEERTRILNARADELMA